MLFMQILLDLITTLPLIQQLDAMVVLKTLIGRHANRQHNWNSNVAIGHHALDDNTTGSEKYNLLDDKTKLQLK